MAKKKIIPFRNRNHSDWWIASFIERFEFYDENKKNNNRRCKAWENTILVKSRNREEAYKKAIKIGKMSSGSEAYEEDTLRKGSWVFEGLTSLLPIYERIKDGSEILWKEYDGRSVKKIKSLVKSKEELEAFDDRIVLK